MIKLLIGIFLLFSVICFGTDFIFYLKNRYCRFHIGRWNEKDWHKAVEKTARRWIGHTPTVKITDNSRYMLFDIFSGRYRSGAIQSWQKAALILGLLESNDDISRSIARNSVTYLIDEHGMWKKKPITVDCGMLSYAILKAADDPLKVRPAMDYALSIIKNSLNEYGMVSYTGGRDNPEMYVDTLGLVCPFLALYARVYGDKKCEKTAYNQLEIYHSYGLLNDTALPNHAFNIETKLPLGVYGWGRGTAWYLIGLMDTYKELQTREYKSDVWELISEAANAYRIFQHEDGGFGSILQCEGSYDSSATASMAWFYASFGKLTGNSEYYNISKRSIKMLRTKTRITGAIDDCQGDTKGIGIFAQTYDIMPFAQGMALRAINELNP